MSQNDKGNIDTESSSVDPRTISDFGEQWALFSDNEGYFSSLEYLQDVMGGHITYDEFQGKRVGEIGSGTGRWVPLLVEAGAEHVVAVEPSDSMDILKANTKAIASKVTYI